MVEVKLQYPRRRVEESREADDFQDEDHIALIFNDIDHRKEWHIPSQY
jgi:hypothetical protein